MASPQSLKAPRARQARKSLAHVPFADSSGDKENLTVDSAALLSLTAQGKQASKKSRSKSLGPGGLDALKESTGNKQEVGFPNLWQAPRSNDIAYPTTSLQIDIEANDTIVTAEEHTTPQWRWQRFSWKSKSSKYTRKISTEVPCE